MKVAERVLDVDSTLTGENVRMGIDEAAIQHIIGVLTDLYSDPELAVIREYSTNALDSHVEAGNTAPIEVTTPTNLAPFFRVKDYGIGLDADGIRSIYSKYGVSTKRDTDEQVGMLGLGAKSALTYSDQFTLVATKNGRTVQVSIGRDEDGGGSMTIVSDEPSDAPNGVEIIVPVKRDNDFEYKAREFFRFWKPGTVLLNGEQPTTIVEGKENHMLQYTIIGNEDGESNIVVFVAGQAPQVASQSRPNFDAIVAGALAGDDSVIELFDIAATAAQKFQRLSERVTTANGRLYLDGEEVNNALSTQVLRFMDEGVEDWKPLVAFFENVQANPNEHSREQLYTWLARRDFTITADGMIVGYKGVASDDNGGYLSIHSGKAIVDGETVTGRIPTNPGSTVEMPRSEVEWNPSVGCHTGLHVGTFEYAENFAEGTVLEVHVNPRDVVSVPTDSDAAKVRTCRYHIVSEIEVPYSEAVIGYGFDHFTDDEDIEAWGDGEGECEVPAPAPYDYAADAANGPSLGLQC